MQTTTHYGFNIVEGSDVVNPLTQLNPNFTNLDTDLYNIANTGICPATETVSGGVHSIIRSQTDKAMFKFFATGDWMENDVMNVDGNVVTVKTISGADIPAGAYVTGSAVIGILNNGNVTLLVDDNRVPAANEIDYKDTNVAGALNSLGRMITVFEQEAYADGQTWVLPQAAQDVIDAGLTFLIEADFYYGDTYSSARLVKVMQRGFGGQTLVGLDRSAIQLGYIRIDPTSFAAFGFDVTHAPKLRNLYLFPMFPG